MEGRINMSLSSFHEDDIDAYMVEGTEVCRVLIGAKNLLDEGELKW